VKSVSVESIDADGDPFRLDTRLTFATEGPSAQRPGLKKYYQGGPAGIGQPDRIR
jgi:hypothetical protein